VAGSVGGVQPARSGSIRIRFTKRQWKISPRRSLEFLEGARFLAFHDHGGTSRGSILYVRSTRRNRYSAVHEKLPKTALWETPSASPSGSAATRIKDERVSQTDPRKPACDSRSCLDDGLASSRPLGRPIAQLTCRSTNGRTQTAFRVFAIPTTDCRIP
jgi:hypothetical protein